MTTADGLRATGPDEALLLTPEEAARLLRIGRTTVYALMKAGHLRPVHIGRSCRLARAELERYVNRLNAPEPTERRRPPQAVHKYRPRRTLRSRRRTCGRERPRWIAPVRAVTG